MEHEPGIFQEFLSGMRNVLSERLVSPLMPAFVISWLVLNYRFVVIVFSDESLPSKLTLIDTVLFPTWTDVLLRGFVIPLAAALIYIFAYPYPARWVYGFALSRQRELREARQRAENARVLTVEESQRLRTYYYDRERALQKQEQDRLEEIEQLRAKIAELEKPKRQNATALIQDYVVQPPPTDLPLSELHAKALGALSFAENDGHLVTDESDFQKILGKDATDVKIILEELQRKGLVTQSHGARGNQPGPFYGLTHEGRIALKDFISEQHTHKRGERAMKSIAQLSAEFLAGLQNIERAIIAKIRERGLPITADSFRWNYGKEFVPPPEAIPLEIKFQGKSANGILSREQVEDSHSRIDRKDVIAMIDDLVKNLST